MVLGSTGASKPKVGLYLSGTGDSQRDSRESFAIETPVFIARQADAPEARH